MKRYAVAVLVLLVSSGLLACHYLEVLVVDTPKYSISGVVREAQDVEDLLDKAATKGISNADVAIRCPGTEKAVTQNRAGTTDENGFYGLEGYWDLDRCSIIFEHQDYEPETIVIDKRYLISSEESLWVYEVDIRLEPKGDN
jgi:hypothetical protein